MTKLRALMIAAGILLICGLFLAKPAPDGARQTCTVTGRAVDAGSAFLDHDLASGNASGTCNLENPADPRLVWVVFLDAFTVISSDEDPDTAQDLAEVLAGQDPNVPKARRATLQEAVQANDSVLVLHAVHRLGQNGMAMRPLLPDGATDKEILTALKHKKVIGVGSAAMGYFRKLCLEIAGGPASSSGGPIEMTVQKNATLGKAWSGQRIVATVCSADCLNGPMHIPRKDPQCTIVEVLARSVEDDDYAPVVRQGNYVMTWVEAPPSAWPSTYRRFFRELALAMRARPLEPFQTSATLETTKPGVYKFELAKHFNAGGPCRKIFHFNFTKPTRFTAHLDHTGPGATLLFFHGGPIQVLRGASAEISFDVTQRDIERMEGRYSELEVLNYATDNAAHCELTVAYEPGFPG